MEFLAVVCGLMLLYWPHAFAGVQKDTWFVGWRAKLARLRVLPENTLVRPLATLFLPVLFIWLLLGILSGIGVGLLYFLVNLVVLLYAFGRGDARDQVEELINDLQRGDLQAAFHDLALFDSGDPPNDQMDDTPTFARELTARLAYTYVERYLAVLFWFVVAGAPLALLYRLLVAYQDNSACSANERSVAQRGLWLMEWLPVRMAGLTMALVGRFDTGMDRWRGTLWCQHSSQQTMYQLVSGALDGDDQIIDQAELAGEEAEVVKAIIRKIRTVEKLFFNTVVCWLVAISVWVIVN